MGTTRMTEQYATGAARPVRGQCRPNRATGMMLRNLTLNEKRAVRASWVGSCLPVEALRNRAYDAEFDAILQRVKAGLAFGSAPGVSMTESSTIGL
jgi:hypothetical protein